MNYGKRDNVIGKSQEFYLCFECNIKYMWENLMKVRPDYISFSLFKVYCPKIFVSRNPLNNDNFLKSPS